MPGVAYSKSYTYDAVGNRLTKTDTLTGETTTSTYDAASQLVTSIDNAGTTSYTYDGNGNLTTIEDPSNAITTYTWDQENRRTKVELPSSEVVSSMYDGDGRRIQRVDSVGSKKFVWDEQNYLAEQLDELVGAMALAIELGRDEFRFRIHVTARNACSFYE